jgi:hypothetical protein
MPAKPGPLRPHEERQIYNRPEPLPDIPGQPSLGDSFLIVTEGEVTEKMYFESVRSKLRLKAATVHVVHPGCTDARGLVEAAILLKDEPHQRRVRGELGNREVEGFDHVWVVFDADIPHRQGQLTPALQVARANGIKVALSTPSVELWLLLHFRDRPGPFLDSHAAEQAVAEALVDTYDKSEETFLRLWPRLNRQIVRAVQRAGQIRQYHQASGAPFPPNPSTDADLLVLAMNAAVQPHLRII